MAVPLAGANWTASAGDVPGDRGVPRPRRRAHVQSDLRAVLLEKAVGARQDILPPQRPTCSPVPPQRPTRPRRRSPSTPRRGRPTWSQWPARSLGALLKTESAASCPRGGKATPFRFPKESCGSEVRRSRPCLHTKGARARKRARSRARMVARTAEQMRRRAENERRRYTARRLASLRKRFPELPPDVLERAALRQVSVAVRRAGVGQGTLSASSEAECSPGPVSR